MQLEIPLSRKWRVEIPLSRKWGVEISLSRKWRVEISLSRKWRVEISLIGLTLPHYCICPKPRSGFPFAYVKIFFVFNDIEAKGSCSHC
jgi:hypothetical protein